MRLFIALFSIVALLPFVQLGSVETVTLEGVDSFQGDRHGEFVGNPVAILSDDSNWKVHPDDIDRFSQWKVGEAVHVDVRTSPYSFKREHKFSLFNHTREEEVKAMFVGCEPNLLKIAWASDVYATGGDGFGQNFMPRRDLVLNDGSYWTLTGKTFFSTDLDLYTLSLYHSKLQFFRVGKKVYLGVDQKKGKSRPFLISGKEREAVWAWAYPID